MIKLRSLINLTEQAPQAPALPPTPGAPVPMQAPPPTAAPTEEPAPEPESDTTPAPEDPGEYDWTKDFRAFEDAKNKAEAAAKKKLLDKMNKQLTGKKITVNASRGYGQPKTDHTIDQVKKISVEFWYKEWVAIITDENDKKYFLTPGVNIKIESGGEEGAAGAEAPGEPEAAPTGAGGEEEQPNVPATGAEGEAQPGAEMGLPPAPAGGESPPAPGQPPVPGTVPPEVPGQPPAAPEAPAPAPEQPPVVPKKKKKVAETVSAWSVGKDLHLFLMEFLRTDIKNNNDLSRYVKSVKSVINENRSESSYHAKIEIPVDHMISNFDPRDLKLAVKESMWSSGNIDQRFSRGSIDISKVGRIYLMEFVKETGWKS